MTTAIRASGMRPASMLSAMATKFDPRPESRIPRFFMAPCSQHHNRPLEVPTRVARHNKKSSMRFDERSLLYNFQDSSEKPLPASSPRKAAEPAEKSSANSAAALRDLSGKDFVRKPYKITTTVTGVDCLRFAGPSQFRRATSRPAVPGSAEALHTAIPRRSSVLA